MANPSGIIPLDLKVLVKPDVPKEKIGAVYIPEQAQDKAKYAGMKGTLVAIGPNAFKEWGPSNGPEPGTRVLFAQYSGIRQKGADGEDYLVMNDQDIISVLDKEANV